MLPWKKIEIWDLQTAGNAFKLLILPPPRCFCIISNLLLSHQADFFGSWGGGGGECVRTPRTPLPTGLSQVVVLHDCGATWFQTSSFSQTVLVPNSVFIRHVFIQSSADQRRFASTKGECWMARRRLNIARSFETTVVLMSRFSRAQFSLVRHDLSATFETGLYK